ncbi:MAG: hypothetical protein V1826_00065 [bacterium]
MKIGLDFNGVIADCAGLKQQWITRLFGKLVPYENLPKAKLVGDGWLSVDQYNALKHCIYTNEGFGSAIQSVPGAIVCIKQLLQDGHEIIVVTSRWAESLTMAQDWVRKQGLDLSVMGVGLGNSKAPAAAGLDVFVDDDLENLQDLVGVVPNRFLFNWDYNRDDDLSGVGERVKSWDELYRAIQAIEVRV